MARLNDIKIKGLSIEDLNKYPVWAWDDSMEYQCPLEIVDLILPKDEGVLFVKAKLKTNNGTEFDGVVVGTDPFFSFAVFADGEKFNFNLNVSQLIMKELQRMASLIKVDADNVFPITYETDFVRSDGGKVCGQFDVDT